MASAAAPRPAVEWKTIAVAAAKKAVVVVALCALAIVVDTVLIVNESPVTIGKAFAWIGDTNVFLFGELGKMCGLGLDFARAAYEAARHLAREILRLAYEFLPVAAFEQASAELLAGVWAAVDEMRLFRAFAQGFAAAFVPSVPALLTFVAAVFAHAFWTGGTASFLERACVPLVGYGGAACVYYAVGSSAINDYAGAAMLSAGVAVYILIDRARARTARGATPRDGAAAAPPPEAGVVDMYLGVLLCGFIFAIPASLVVAGEAAPAIRAFIGLATFLAMLLMTTIVGSFRRCDA